MIRLIRLCLPAFVFLLAPTAYAADALCPDLEELRANAPSDMAGVQADIDRMKLCVERAQLLQQLDQVAQDRKKILDEANGISSSGGNPNGGFSTGMNGIPPLPVSQLPPLKTNAPVASANLQPGAIQVTNAASGALGSVTDQLAQMSGSWSVRKIWGQKDAGGGMAGGGMRAQLVNGTGTILNVVKGDALPDGSVVESLSVRGVALSQNGKVTDVQWEQSAAPSPLHP